MPDLLGSLCLFAFGVFLFALVGHGIWVLGAAVFQARFGTRQSPKPLATQPVRGACPACGRLLTAGGTRCTTCGWDRDLSHTRRPNQPVGTAHQAASLDALAGQVKALRDKG